MQNAHANEPGVTKYLITIPQTDANDSTSVYMIEAYASQSALDSHIATPQVQALLTLFKTEPSLLAEPPKVYPLKPFTSFTRPEIDAHSDPYIVFGILTYKAGSTGKAAEGWKRVCVATEANEKGTLSYNVAENTEEERVLSTLEIYESKEYLWKVHAKSEAVSTNKKMNIGIREGLDLAFLRKVEGYLFK
ncbi:hypothetical protein LTS18_009705 [Coniosporium uncinatum]|uniref:Uncharacterized protein n=1 Tax=Coniosporium uncinatum TaxID=93489 RepID=A0ACC3DCD1_9PEZI|nr:hypothetical protein LTS18_009705 [Coniosporium uncinatum]